MPAPATPLEFAVGQRWAFTTDAGPGMLVIGRIDGGELPAIHVSIESPSTVGHMPFTPEALLASVTGLLASDASVSDLFAGGIADWEEAHGGAFTLSVGEALEATRSILPDEVRADLIDRLVRDMRETRRLETVEQVYSELLRLNRWVFLGDPTAPTTPLLWVFTDSDEPAPCLLAWTTAERAEAFAAEQGWEPTVVAPPVGEAIDWILGTLAPNEGIDRIEFNAPAEEGVALYIETLQQLVSDGEQMP